MTDTIADTLALILFWTIIAFTLLSIFYPWKKRNPKAKVSIHLPAFVFPLFIAYEYFLPAKYNIRVDLLILMPVLLIALLIYISKLHQYRSIN
jgi:peptidoglycan/LPS O-acetylase OafA/YrhL